jgi:hypothetical protein
VFFFDDPFFLIRFMLGEKWAAGWAMDLFFSDLAAAEAAYGFIQGRAESFGFAVAAS